MQGVSAELDTWYAGRRVFLTGHTGFKGAWLALWLQEMGAIVTGYALAAERPSLFELAGVASGMQSVIGDIRDRDDLQCAMRESAPEIVIHMAAQALVRRSYADPIGTYATNVIGTAQVLDIARRVDTIRSVVIVTSDKCYENDLLSQAHREDGPMGGFDPYSSSKGCAELVTAAFARSFFPGKAAVGSVRAGNVVGGGDWGEDRLIPDLMRGAMSGTPVLIRRPDSIRPWQFVLEPLRGYLILAKGLAESGAVFAGGWNFGPLDDRTTVRELVRCVQARWSDVRVEYAAELAGPHEAPALMLDCAKAQKFLNWRPVLSLDETVALTVEWYREAYSRPREARNMICSQIRAYQARVDRLEGGVA